MDRLLTADQLSEVMDAALAADLVSLGMRDALLAHMDPKYVAILKVGLPNAKAQYRIDFARFNRAGERLEDGSVPLELWLRAAIDLSATEGSIKVFRRMLDLTNAGAHGISEPEARPIQPDEIPEKIIGRDDMVPYPFLGLGSQTGASVARISVTPFENGQRRVGLLGNPHAGTAWLVTPELVFTNHHVVRARSKGEPPPSDQDLHLQGANSELWFDYDHQDAQVHRVATKELVAFSDKVEVAPDQPVLLDYAILRTAQPVPRTPLRLNTGELTAAGALPLNIIQHPGGLEKRVALRNNLISSVEPYRVCYFSDTNTGSSGSPVLDDDWRVVALHRSHEYAAGVTYLGREEAYVNVGTPISAILDHLRQTFPAIADEIEGAQEPAQ